MSDTTDKKSKTKSEKKQTSPTKTIKGKKQSTPNKENFQNVKISGFNSLPLNVYVFNDTQIPKAVVLIIHGMQEHALRYKSFAENLNKNDFIVVASDLRGHGLTAPSIEKRGYGEKDIFTETIQDQMVLIDWIKQNFNLPIFVFGHSYGSMLSQVLVQHSPLVEKAVICGTANGSSALMKLGGMVTSLFSPFKSNESGGGLIEKICIKSYGKKFKNGNWLTRDENIFEQYIADPYCGGSFPFGFYKSMIKNMNKANKGIEKIGNKKLFLIAGDKDPVGSNGKQVKQLYKLYLKKNINASIKIYPDCRHELLNEINKDEIIKDVIDFFND